MRTVGLRRATNAGFALEGLKASAVLAALIALNVIGLIAIVAITVQ